MNKQVGLGWVMTLLLTGTSALAQTQNTTIRSDSASTTTTASSAAPAMKPGGTTGRDLIVSAARSGSHTTLFRLMRVSGLTDQASGKGPFTVFAPTNEAFDKLPAGTLDELIKPTGKAKLTKVLAYHVVRGKVRAEQLQDGQTLRTVTGGVLTVNKEGDAITITDGAGNTATINQADIEATNGMIHSVDAVLMPATGSK